MRISGSKVQQGGPHARVPDVGGSHAEVKPAAQVVKSVGFSWLTKTDLSVETN